MSENMPERINAILCMSYDVSTAISEIAKGEERLEEDITLEDVMDYIESLVGDEFGTARDFIYQDEHGEDVVA